MNDSSSRNNTFTHNAETLYSSMFQRYAEKIKNKNRIKCVQKSVGYATKKIDAIHIAPENVNKIV